MALISSFYLGTERERHSLQNDDCIWWCIHIESRYGGGLVTHLPGENGFCHLLHLQIPPDASLVARLELRPKRACEAPITLIFASSCAGLCRMQPLILPAYLPGAICP